MSIRRRKKTRAFTQIDNAALRNPKLSLKAKGLLAVMMSCPEDWQFYMDWLQGQSSDGRESHQTAMKELEGHGYVVRERTQGEGGKFSGWEYLVDDEPQIEPTHEVPPTNGKAVNRLSTDERENRLTGKPTDGKPAASNTDFKKNEFNKEGGEYNVEDNARAGAFQEPHVPTMALSSPAQPTSSGDAALQQPEDLPVMVSATALPFPHVTSPLPLILEQHSSDGVAAYAAGAALDLMDEAVEAMFGTPASTEALEQVPGGGRATEAPRDLARPAVALTVAALPPVSQAELASRPLAAPESAARKALREILGKQLPMYLSERTRTGDLSRELWLRLTEAEIRQVILTARLEAAASKDNVITLVVRGLDRRIGAVKAPTVDVPSPAVHGGGALAPAKKPEVDSTPETGKYLQGARWQPKTGGQEVVLVGLKQTPHGSQYLLSDGRQLKSLDLILGFEFVTPGQGPLQAH